VARRRPIDDALAPLNDRPSGMARTSATDRRLQMPVGRSIRLTPLRSTDADMMFGWINERDTVLFNAPYRPISEIHHRTWFEAIQRDRDAVIFGIRALPDERLVGYCQLVNIHWVHRSAELRIRLGEEQDRGHGYGTDAVRMLVDFAFRDLNLRRVVAHVFASNPRAERIYEKVGFGREGVLRRAAHIDGCEVDVVIMSILRDE
jgi:RimJ/RimL family protein N-acetyltransferase